MFLIVATNRYMCPALLDQYLVPLSAGAAHTQVLREGSKWW